MKDAFSKELCLRLIENYGRIPSAAVFARDFNLKNRQFSPISQETARRWIRGISVPELDRLKTLVEWLNMDLGFVANQQTALVNNPELAQRTSQLDRHEQKIIDAYRKADIVSKRILFAVAKAINP
jgi:transcriptional regulator with XRE-family HTH domain